MSHSSRIKASEFDKPFSSRENIRILHLMETRYLLLATTAESDATRFYWVAMARALYDKNPSYGALSDLDREKAAYEKWLQAEERCKDTNRRFTEYERQPELLPVGRGPLIHNVTRKIAQILGVLPDWLTLTPGFGKGACVGVNKHINTRAKLASDNPTASPSVWYLLSELAKTHPHWQALTAAKIADSVLAFVPKNARIFRATETPQTVNVYLQKAYGSYMKGRLKKHGCDLYSQETNRDLCRYASVRNCLATIDLRSASDTLALKVVESLLPYDWYSILKSLRSGTVKYKSSRIHLHKFAGMGNATAFEIESLIFFAIAKVVCEDHPLVSVYGDDIIVPVQYADAVMDALDFFGFIVNDEKSFVDGPFRESCGKDYYNGQDVRPVFLKDCLSIMQLYRVHNFFKRNLDEDTAAFVRSFIPQAWVGVVGPDGYGDGHLIGDFNHVRRTDHPTWALRGFKSFARDPITHKRGKSRYAAILFERGTSMSQRTVGGIRGLEILSLRLKQDTHPQVYNYMRRCYVASWKKYIQDLIRARPDGLLGYPSPDESSVDEIRYEPDSLGGYRLRTVFMF